MAVGISREELGITKDKVMGKIKYQHVYRLYGNVLFFEYGESKIILSIPVVVQYTDYLDHVASDEEQFNIIKSLYTGSIELNIFDFLCFFILKESTHVGFTILDKSWISKLSFNFFSKMSSS